MAVKLKLPVIEQHFTVEEFAANSTESFVLWCINTNQWEKRDFEKHFGSSFDIDNVVYLLCVHGLLMAPTAPWRITEKGSSFLRQIAASTAQQISSSEMVAPAELTVLTARLNARFEVEQELEEQRAAGAKRDYHQNPFDLTVLLAPTVGDWVQGREEVYIWLIGKLSRKTPFVCELTGMTGVGKTTFAAFAVRQLIEAGFFSDGVAAIRCNDQQDPGTIIAEILTRLDPEARRPMHTTNPSDSDKDRLRQALNERLRNKDILVVLDNVEFQSSLEEVITTLKEVHAKVLILGSYSSLHIPDREIGRLRLLNEEESLWYFAKVYRSRRGVELDESDVDAIRQIVKAKQIGGHPLLVQIAASEAAEARRRHKLSRFTEGINREEHGRSHTLSFHQDFENRIRHLPDHIRQFMMALGVFRTVEFSVNAARDLGNALDLGRKSQGDMVSELIQWSLFQSEEIDLPRGGDSSRVWLHGFLHGWAQAHFERLSPARRQSIQRAAIAYYIEYLDSLDKLVRQRELSAFQFERIVERDRGNIKGVIEHALSLHDDAAVLKLCALMRGFWYNRRYIEECSLYLPRAIEAANRLRKQDTRRETLRLLSDVEFTYAQLERRLGNFEQSKRLLDENLKIRQELSKSATDAARSDKERVAETLVELSIVNRVLGELGAADGNIQESLNLRQGQPDQRGMAQSYTQLGRLALWRGELQAARKWLKQGHTIAQNTQDLKTQGDTLLYLGQIERQIGDPDSAERLLKDGRSIMEEIEDLSGVAFALYQLAKVARSKGDYILSQQLAEQSLNLRQQILDRRGVGEVLGHLAQVARELGQLDTAETYLSQSREYATQTQDKRGEGIVVTQFGLLYLARKDYTAAKEYLKKSLSIHKDVDDQRGEGADYGYLGKIAMAEGNLKEAADYFAKSLSIAEDVKDREGESNILVAQGMLAARRGSPDSALTLMRKGVRIARRIQAHPLAASFLLEIARIYAESVHDDGRAKRYAQEALKELARCTAEPATIRKTAEEILKESANTLTSSIHSS